MSLNKVTPEEILKIVDFNIEEGNSWQYDKTNKDMYAYQAEGAAGIWNRLEHFGLAILADEVGMGKTYQALAVVAKQFQEKPTSKVLIITPRYEVLRQWKEEEYEEFRNHHLKDKNLLPIKEELGELVNLNNGFLSRNHKTDNSKIIFAKTTSLSIGNTDIKKCHVDLSKFDLVIVDEAHKFRNFNSNLRTKNTLDIFNHIKDIKILLMSATPLHSNEDDILNIVNVFKPNIFRMFPQEVEPTSKSVRHSLMIRRLRVLSGNYNKYHYRAEKELAVDMTTQDGDYMNELFFAMLQKQIINSPASVNYSKSKHLLNLLEGTTFDDHYNEEQHKEIENQDDKSKKQNQKSKKTFDKVVEIFKECYEGKTPSNQKYNVVLNKIKEDDEKALVFVRRRASAIELTRQYIEEFDKKAWFYLTGNENHSDLTREAFDEYLQDKKIDSKVDVFISKKVVKEYFNDYKSYINLPKKTRDVTILKKMAKSFFYSFQEFSLDNFEDFKKDNKSREEEQEDTLPKSKILSFFKSRPNEVSTSASRFVRKFDKGRSYETFFTEFLPKRLDYENHEEKFDLIKSAIIHSSFGIVELFKCDLKAPKYDSFCKNVEKIIEDSHFKKEIDEFIKHFSKYEKYIKFNNNVVNKGKKNGEEPDENIKTYDETIFHNAQPAYSYLANTKNKSVIARFNSPFFPNLLCGTSTLQEGLNLHLQCNKVYHFGSAHTMGDDEQRTGRIDRIHGKMYRELQENKNSEIPKLYIHYPYLRNTFDEENLRNMLCSKRITEKKIDRCEIEANIQDTTKIMTNDKCEKPIGELIYKGDEKYITDEKEPFGWEMKY